MTRADETISAAWAEVLEDEARLDRQRAYEILRTIPTGTHDDDLTPEQRRAWKVIEGEE